MFNLESLKGMPLWQLTVEQFIFVQQHATALSQTNEKTVNKEPSERYVYGLEGLCKLLNCGHTTASNLKNSGKLEGCYTQIDRKIVFDVDAIMERLKELRERGNGKR